MRAFSRALGLLVIVGLFIGCGDQSGETAQTSANETSSTTANPTATAGAITGEVLETMNSGGYTYVRLDQNGEEVWAAGPESPMDVGRTVSVSTNMPMKAFRSETLDRSFDTLYFVNGWGDGGSKADPHAGLDMGDMAKNDGPMAGHGQTPSADVDAGDVQPVEGGHTVAALHEARAQLAGSTTSVRGRVVKFNGGIMGKNWVHVQDGTGEVGAKTHDLLITTDARCEVGDLITATGTVAVDRDFGSGYQYELLLEDASIEVDRSTTGR